MHIDIAACGVRQTVQMDGRGGLGCALVFPTEFIGCWQPEGWAHPVCTGRRSLVRYTDHKIGNTLSYKKEKNATLASHYNTVRFNRLFHNDHNQCKCTGFTTILHQTVDIGTLLGQTLCSEPLPYKLVLCMQLTHDMKPASCHGAIFVVTGGTEGCRQWRQSWHHENSRHSVDIKKQ